jgi:hypothetical protein
MDQQRIAIGFATFSAVVTILYFIIPSSTNNASKGASEGAYEGSSEGSSEGASSNKQPTDSVQSSHKSKFFSLASPALNKILVSNNAKMTLAGKPDIDQATHDKVIEELLNSYSPQIESLRQRHESIDTHLTNIPGCTRGAGHQARGGSAATKAVTSCQQCYTGTMPSTVAVLEDAKKLQNLIVSDGNLMNSNVISNEASYLNFLVSELSKHTQARTACSATCAAGTEYNALNNTCVKSSPSSLNEKFRFLKNLFN